MDTEKILFEAAPLGVNCVALHKIAKRDDLSLPMPHLHVYLAGLIERVNDPANQKKLREYVVGSKEHLAEVVERHRSDEMPFRIPFYAARHSGDFFTDMNAQLVTGRELEFPVYCYEQAQIYGKEMGRKTEVAVFNLLARTFGVCLELLARYYQAVRFDPLFEINERDYQAFKKEFPELVERIARIEQPSKLKQDIGDKLIM